MSTGSTHSSNARRKGIALVLFGTILWGVSGTVAQYLFQNKGFNPEWLVVARLLASGILLLLSSFLFGKTNIWKIWSSRHSILSILLFGLFGMLGVQYTYFAAIDEGNAATATLLQYLGPVFITAFIALKTKTIPNAKQIFAITLALAGTFFLVTSGNFHELSISKLALFWGLASAVALAFYTLQPIRLLHQWGSAIVVGWGMIIGGVGMSFIHPPWKIVGEISPSSILAIIFVILFGTLIAFYCYLESLKYLSATETSLLGCAEPLSAAVLSVIWLHVPFGIFEWIGSFCIMATIIILARTKNSNKVNSPVN